MTEDMISFSIDREYTSVIEILHTKIAQNWTIKNWQMYTARINVIDLALLIQLHRKIL